MNAEYAKMRRHAEATLSEMNRHLDNAETKKDPQRHAMVTATARDATETLKNLDKMENKRPYSDTNIGYNADMRQRSNAYDDTNEMVRSMLNAFNKLLPQISDDYESNDMEMRQGVPGTGPYGDRRLKRGNRRYGTRSRRYEADRYDATADMDDRYDMDDDMDDMEMRRRRSPRTGRFIRGDYDDAVTRAAAEAAATTARHMAANPHGVNDIYPTTPVMPHNTHDTARNDMRREVRSEADTNYDRSDDATSDRGHRPGPGMRG